MASPPFSINETVPGDTDLASQFPSLERAFRDVVKSYLNTDHDAATGHHGKVGLVKQAGDPAAVADTGWVFAKNVSGATELFYMDHAGAVKQLTSGGKLAIASGDIAAGLVSSTHLADGAVLLGKLAADAFAGAGSVAPEGADSLVLSDASDGGKTKRTGVSQVLGLAPFTKSFSSGQLALSAGGTHTVAHGLGVRPKLIQWEVECLTGEFGYSAGQRLPLGGPYCEDGGSSSVNTGWTAIWDETNVFVKFVDAPNHILRLVRLDTAVNTSFTTANWALRFTAFA